MIKKNSLSLFAAFFTAWLTQSVYAGEGGSGIGNGGDAVVCSNGAVSLLDYTEADFYGKTIFLTGSSYRKKVATGINRFNRASKNIEKLLLSYTSEILEDVELYFSMQGQPLAQINQKSKNIIFTKNDLVDVPDSDHMSIPPGCRVQQLVIQKDPENSLQKRYVIDVKLLDKLNDTNIAGMILHEAIYRIAAHISGHLNSVQTRALNIFIGSNESQPRQEVVNALIDFKFISEGQCQIDLFIEGFYLSSDRITFSNNRNISGYLCEKGKQKTGDFVFEFMGKVLISDSRIVRGELYANIFPYRSGFVQIETGSNYYEKENGVFTLSEAVLYSPSYSKHVRDLEFTQNGISYKKVGFGAGNGLLKIKHPLAPLEQQEQESDGMILNDDLTLRSVDLYQYQVKKFQGYRVVAPHFEWDNKGNTFVRAAFWAKKVELKIASGETRRFKLRGNNTDLMLTFNKDQELVDVKQ